MQPKQFELPIFNPGKRLLYNGQFYTVDYVKIIGHLIKVKFKELDIEVESKFINCDPTVFVLK